MTSSPSQRARTLCLCFDGTGNKFGEENSNIVRFFRALEKRYPDQQRAYYQAGIGTYQKHHYLTRSASFLSSAIDQAVALDLNDHVKEGYRFLMQNYRPNDKICLFGFSRGAYTARALAGMLYKVGLLPPHNTEQVDFAFNMYQSTDKVSARTSKEFKDTFAIPVTIDFIGVWDTVSSVGIIPRQLPYSSAARDVKFFRHALALDECRARFRPNLWNEPKPVREEVEHGMKVNVRGNKSRDEWVYDAPDCIITDVKEVWFAGCHADVGGGSHKSTIQDSLSGIPLRWMITECFATNTGIIFDHEYLKDIGLDPATLAADQDPVPADSHPFGSNLIPNPTIATARHLPGHDVLHRAYEKISGHMPHTTIALRHAKDHIDAVASIYDQLRTKFAWWTLELLPMLIIYHQQDGLWRRERIRNFGRGRIISPTNKEIMVHSSVRARMLQKEGYKPAAVNWELVQESVKWVD